MFDHHAVLAAAALARRAYSRLPPDPPWPHPIASSDPLALLKSSFHAHASRLPPTTADPRTLDAHARSLVAHLAAVAPRTRRATHAMYAWRAAHVCGASDGGESGAGARLARLLALARCDDVVLVVHRCHGGVPLRARRWKCISAVAKQALVRGGFMRPREQPDGAHVGAGKSARRRR